MKDVLLGIDVGTTGCKTALYTLEGVVVAEAYREYPLRHPRPDWVEQDAEMWWKAVAETTTSVVEKAAPHRIAALGVSCTNALVCVDGQGNPLIPAIMQLDQRSAPQARWISQTIGAESILATTGNRIAAGSYSAPIIRWIKENAPAVYERTAQFLVPTGFIVHKLTGRFSMDHSRASATMLFDIRRQAWSEPLTHAMAVDVGKLPALFPSSGVVGQVSARAAGLTGLKAGTPVVAGCVDTVSAALGAGAVEPGQTFAVLGTVGRVGVVTDGSRFDDRMMNFCHGAPDRWLTNAAVNAAGASLRWFRDAFWRPEAGDADPYDRLTAEAAASPPGAGGLVFLPYLAGERSPLWNGNARGMLYGLTLSHTRADVIRSLLEGVGYALRHNLEIMRGTYGVTFDRLTLAGGGAKSRLWRQIVADVLEAEVQVPAVLDSEALGAALLAGTGCRAYADIGAAARQAVRMVDAVGHDGRRAEKYDRMFAAYQACVERFSDRFDQLCTTIGD
jgi:xylulokinase